MVLKKGDILKFMGGQSYDAEKGAKAIYIEHYQGFGDEEYIRVEWIRDELSNGQEDGGYYEYMFEKIEE